MKENNGHGARRQCVKKLAWWGTLVVGIASLVLLTATGLLGGRRTTATAALRSKFDKLRRKTLRRDTEHDARVAPASAHLGISQSELDAILSARVHLIDLQIRTHEIGRRLRVVREEEEEESEDEDEDEDEESRDDAKESDQRPYTGVYATFCRIDWSLHKQQPSTYPMFRDLMAQSPGCRDEKQIQHVPLHDIVRLARQYDQSDHATTHVLDLAGVVFHESRCGSTLVANLLAAVEPDAHRVYSESPPPIKALYQVCGEDWSQCSQRTAATIVQDVVYLMSRRTSRETEQKVFFKIQSAGSRHLTTFTQAFPQTPYLFVYREPVQVMMSHLKQGVRSANCVREHHSPPPSVQRVVHQYTPHKAHGAAAAHLSAEEYCAAHLASLTETVVHAMTDQGVAVNYADLVPRLTADIFPHWLGVDALSEPQLQRVHAVAGIYSKNRGGNRVPGEFQSDSARKQDMASAKVKDAANVYLLPSYVKLEQMADAARRHGHADTQ